MALFVSGEQDITLATVSFWYATQMWKLSERDMRVGDAQWRRFFFSYPFKKRENKCSAKSVMYGNSLDRLDPAWTLLPPCVIRGNIDAARLHLNRVQCGQ